MNALPANPSGPGARGGVASPCGAGWAGVAGLVLALAALGQGPAVSRPTSEPASRPVEKNMFLAPLGRSVAASQPTAPPPAPELRPFTLVGVTHAGASKALVSLSDPDELHWMEKGQRVAGLEVVAVEPSSAVFRVGEVVGRLQTGQSSALLLGGQQTLTVHCRLLGVYQSGDRAFALAAPEGQRAPVHLAVGDALPGGRITAIRSDGLVLTWRGAGRVLLVGQSTKELSNP